MAQTAAQGRAKIDEPRLLKALFNNPSWSWLFIPLRLWLGYEWIDAARHKLADPKWMETGAALQGFWTNAAKVPETGRPPIAFGWYREFVQFLLDSGAYTWFAKLISIGELLIGIALVIGAFTAIAAFFGAMMNMNFMLAGSASTNPILFISAVLIVLGWKVAGHWGLDRVLLPKLGTPWGRLGGRQSEDVVTGAGAGAATTR